TALGIQTVASAGNSGAAGLFVAGTPGLDTGVLSVGSIANSRWPTIYSGADSEGLSFKYSGIFPLPEEHMTVYFVGNESVCIGNWLTANATVPMDQRNNTLILVEGEFCPIFIDLNFPNAMTVKTPLPDPYAAEFHTFTPSDQYTLNFVEV